MITNVETERKVIDHLAQLWNSEVRPHVMTNSCVLSARIASEVFTHFGIEHQVRSMAVMAMNDKMLAHQKNGDTYTAWDPDAWSVGVGFGESMVATNKDFRSRNGFDGHLIVTTDTFYVDLTAYQFDRLEHDIETGGSLVVPVDHFVYPFTLGQGVLNQWLYIGLKRGHLLMTHNKNYDYENSPDWRIHYQRQVGDIIREIHNRIS